MTKISFGTDAEFRARAHARVCGGGGGDGGLWMSLCVLIANYTHKHALRARTRIHACDKIAHLAKSAIAIGGARQRVASEKRTQTHTPNWPALLECLGNYLKD